MNRLLLSKFSKRASHSISIANLPLGIRKEHLKNSILDAPSANWSSLNFSNDVDNNRLSTTIKYDTLEKLIEILSIKSNLKCNDENMQVNYIMPSQTEENQIQLDNFMIVKNLAPFVTANVLLNENWVREAEIISTSKSGKIAFIVLDPDFKENLKLDAFYFVNDKSDDIGQNIQDFSTISYKNKLLNTEKFEKYYSSDIDGKDKLKIKMEIIDFILENVSKLGDDQVDQYFSKLKLDDIEIKHDSTIQLKVPDQKIYSLLVNQSNSDEFSFVDPNDVFRALFFDSSEDETKKKTFDFKITKKEDFALALDRNLISAQTDAKKARILNLPCFSDKEAALNFINESNEKRNQMETSIQLPKIEGIEQLYENQNYTGSSLVHFSQIYKSDDPFFGETLFEDASTSRSFKIEIQNLPLAVQKKHLLNLFNEILGLKEVTADKCEITLDVDSNNISSFRHCKKSATIYISNEKDLTEFAENDYQIMGTNLNFSVSINNDGHFHVFDQPEPVFLFVEFLKNNKNRKNEGADSMEHQLNEFRQTLKNIGVSDSDMIYEHGVGKKDKDYLIISVDHENKLSKIYKSLKTSSFLNDKRSRNGEKLKILDRMISVVNLPSNITPDDMRHFINPNFINDPILVPERNDKDGKISGMTMHLTYASKEACDKLLEMEYVFCNNKKASILPSLLLKEDEVELLMDKQNQYKRFEIRKFFL